MHTEIVKQIDGLPIAERIEIIEEISRGVQRDLRLAGNDGSKSNGDRSREEIIAERKQAVDWLRGIASVPGKEPPTDDEWREERTNYLLEKYK